MYNDKNDLEKLQVTASLKKFVKELPQSYKEENYSQDRLHRVEQEYNDFRKDKKRQWDVAKKASIITLATAASIALFIGSGFVSPTMAEVISKIPTLSTLLKNMEAESNLPIQVTENLRDKGIPVNHVAEHVGGKEEGFYVFLEASPKDIEKIEGDVKEIVNDFLDQEKFKGTTYENYYVKVRQYKEPDPELLAQDEREIQVTNEISEIISPVLESFGYEESLSIGQETITLEFPSVESEEKIENIKGEVSKALIDAGKENVAVNHKVFNLAKRQHYRIWSDTLSAFAYELKTFTKYKVSSVGYKSKNETMYFFIKIKLSSTDPDAEEWANSIRATVEDFIKQEENWSKVKDEPYVIEIRSKDGKVIE
ncbi:DUF4030 domain-containing protein [Bacillus sp. BGMRC 2118]|nr:DUF4030 domain-containing protein [Bacillus sp. BGMRC 2118]